MIREKLQEASFRKVPFLVEDESARRGKKSAVHEYPNSDRRFFEGLGKLPPILTVTAIVHGEDAMQQRFRLERALEEPGVGELVHPVYGTLQVDSGEFSVSSNQRRIGEFRFSITFYTTLSNVTPTPSTPTKQTVSANAENARNALQGAIGNAYTDPESSLNITSAADKLTTIFSDIGDSVLSQKQLLTTESAEFTREVAQQLGNVYKTAKSVQDVQASLESVHRSALSVVDSPSLLSEAWRSVTDFNIGDNGKTSNIGPINTVERKQREENSNSLDEHTRISGLINSYESVSYISFSTEDEIDKAREFVDSRYKSYVEDAISESIDSGVVPLVLNQDLRETLSDLRNAAKQALDEAEQNVFRIVDVNPGETSMSLMTYRYYGSLDNLDTVKELNPSVNHANFDKEIKAVTR